MERLTQVGTTSAIRVPQTTMKFGRAMRVYRAGYVDPGAFGIWHVYVDDPKFKGGVLPFKAARLSSEVFDRDGRIYFGHITTVQP